MTEYDQETLRLLKEYDDARCDEDDAASRASGLAQELEDHGVDDPEQARLELS